ncbi:MAG: hypothetical protein OHK0045_07800 [Raineya sp.]
MKKTLLIAILFLLHYALSAQDNKQEGQSDCSVKLQEGEASFEDGLLTNSISVLEECIKVDGFNKDEKVRAYRLLCIIYLYQNQDDKASENMHNLLRINPEYRLKPNDPAEFVELYKQYKILPYLILGGGAGGNFPLMSIGDLYGTDNPTTQNMTYYSLLGFQVGFNFAKPLNKKIELIFNPNFVLHRYRFEALYFDYAQLNATETQTRVDLTLLLKYNFRNKYNFDLQGFKPYVYLGMSPHLLVSASLSPQRSDLIEGEVRRSVEGKAIPMKSLRNTFTASATLGAGVEYKVGLGHLFADIRYQYALMSVVKNANRYELQEEIARYGFIDNDYKMGAMIFSIGYNYPLYNPKKKEKKIKKTSEDIKIETNN